MKKGIVLLLFLAGMFNVMAQSTAKYQIKFLEINKENSDYGVAILDENKLIFTSALEEAKNNRKNYNPRKDLYVGDIDYDGEIKNVKPVVKIHNKKYNQTGVAYTKDKKTVFFSRNKYAKRKSKQKLAKNQRLEIFKAEVAADGSWQNIKKVPFNKSGSSTGYPVLNSDDSQLYFVSDRKSSLGKTDIFVVDILENGKFSKPRNLGKHVNTTGNETTPFITPDNILYFSSDGHKGMGMLDVFAVEVYDDNATSEVYQLASPINSINDDFAYIVNKDNNQGFFTSNRLQGKGFNDMYSFTLEEDVRPGECFISVDGKVLDIDSKEILAGATVDLYDKEGNLIETVSTYNDGTYNFTVSCANEYRLVASLDNYKRDSKYIEILEENYHSALHTNLNLSKLESEQPKAAPAALQPIYYEFDDATITKAAAAEMDKIVQVMRDNPQLMIEASAYTDARGSNAYNINLSNRRAKAAVEYLKAQGIDPNRIRAKGYGESKMVNHCVNGIDCDEEAHQLNRRTEFNFINSQASYQHKKKPKTQKAVVATRPKVEPKSKVKPKTNAQHQETVVASRTHTEKQKKTLTSSKDSELKIVKKDEQKNEKVAAVQPKVETKNTIAAQADVATKPTRSEIKERRKKTKNKAVDYIEEQKEKVLANLSDLEKSYEIATVQKQNYKDSIAVELQKIGSLKNDIQNTEEVGWSNIIEYKSEVKQFNKKYQKIINEGNNKPTFNNGVTKKNNLSHKEDADTSSDEDPSVSQVIYEESLSVDQVEVIAMKKNKSGKYSVTKSAPKTDLIKVSFKMLHNQKIDAGKKKAHIILQNPEGHVAGAKGVFNLKGNTVQKKYTDQTTINYNKNDVDVTMYIEQRGANLKRGVYPVKLFLEGELVAVSNLDLQSPF